jgi:hypothetical protein
LTGSGVSAKEVLLFIVEGAFSYIYVLHKNKNYFQIVSTELYNIEKP